MGAKTLWDKFRSDTARALREEWERCDVKGATVVSAVSDDIAKGIVAQTMFYPRGVRIVPASCLSFSEDYDSLGQQDDWGHSGMHWMHAMCLPRASIAKFV